MATSPQSPHPTMVMEYQSDPAVHAIVAASTTIAPLVAADLDRRRFIATNPSASTQKVGLTVKSNATFAQCEIILAAGESWVEALAATSAWYVITDGGTINVPVQTAA